MYIIFDSVSQQFGFSFLFLFLCPYTPADNVFPCTCLSVFYYDTTPLDAQDFNINYHMVESSYNLM